MSRVLTGEGRSETPRIAASPDSAWRSLGWFGFALALIGLGQLALYFFPTLAFGSPEWEYGASAQLIGALPLPTIGLGAMLAAAYATGTRWLLITLGVALLLFAAVVLATLGLFWTVAPMALKQTPDAMTGAVQQTVARTTLSGFGFGILYLWTAWRAFRQAGRTPRRSF